MLRALGLGDLLVAVPALRALARAFPHHERVLAAPAPLEPLLALIRDPSGRACLDRLEPVEELHRLPSSLAGSAVAVNLHGRGPQSHRLLLDTQPGRLIAFSHPAVPQSVSGPPWWPGEHEMTRWCRMLAAHGLPADPAEHRVACADGPALAGRPGLAGATIVHPGAASPARRWPAERFAAVAADEERRGRTVYVTGGRDELALAQQVAAGGGLTADRVLAGRTDLGELARVVAGAGRVVCGDTGVAHLATALGTPSVVLFGPVAPSEWGPPQGSGEHLALWTGRRGDPHGDRPDPGLLEITVPTVSRALAAL